MPFSTPRASAGSFVSFVLDQRQALELGAVLDALVTVEAVETEDGALGDRLGAAGAAETADTGAVDDDGGVLDPLLAQEAGDLGREVAHAVDVEALGLAEPGDDDARRLQPAEGVDQRQLALLAPDVAGGDELADRAVHRAVDGAGRAADIGDALEEVDDDRVRLVGADIALLHLDLHLHPPCRAAPPKHIPE